MSESKKSETVLDILVVDDEADIRDILRETLEGQGFSVLEAKDAEEAEALIQLRRPQLVLCDVSMPGKDGLELLAIAARAHSSIGFVMVTAYSESERVVRAMQLGAIDYLVKPFTLDEIRQKSIVWLEIARRQAEAHSARNESSQKLLGLCRVANAKKRAG